MAFVSLNPDATEVIGIYQMPQNEPQPLGYTVIPDDDARIVAFLTLINTPPTGN